MFPGAPPLFLDEIRKGSRAAHPLSVPHPKKSSVLRVLCESAAPAQTWLLSNLLSNLNPCAPGEILYHLPLAA